MRHLLLIPLGLVGLMALFLLVISANSPGGLPRLLSSVEFLLVFLAGSVLASGYCVGCEVAASTEATLEGSKKQIEATKALAKVLGEKRAGD